MIPTRLGELPGTGGILGRLLNFMIEGSRGRRCSYGLLLWMFLAGIGCNRPEGDINRGDAPGADDNSLSSIVTNGTPFAELLRQLGEPISISAIGDRKTNAHFSSFNISNRPPNVVGVSVDMSNGIVTRSSLILGTLVVKPLPKPKSEYQFVPLLLQAGESNFILCPLGISPVEFYPQSESRLRRVLIALSQEDAQKLAGFNESKQSKKILLGTNMLADLSRDPDEPNHFEAVLESDGLRVEELLESGD